MWNTLNAKDGMSNTLYHKKGNEHPVPSSPGCYLHSNSRHASSLVLWLGLYDWSIIDHRFRIFSVSDIQYIHERREITTPSRKKSNTHLFLFISLHLVRFQQEHLKATQIRKLLKLLNTFRNFTEGLKNAPTCSLCFLSFSISSILFFLMPSCSMRQKHLNKKRHLKETRFEARGSRTALSLGR